MKGVVSGLALGLALASSALAQDAVFSHVTYEAIDRTPVSVGAGEFRNPILPGFYPDPSIVRVGPDYYLINSTFAFYPGIPIFHSTDLVNWTQIGNAIDRPGMLDFKGLGSSRGVFAPDISYKDGVFYILNTCVDCDGNFLITARDPKEPWSDPVWLGFDGIDPSLFHDEDGRSYVINNGPPIGTPLYDGHRAIWVQELDRKTLKLTGPRKLIVDGGVDIREKPSWIEGPHLLKKDGAYSLIAAEGGTGDFHSEVVFRSNSVFGPFTPAPPSVNPILTQRDLKPDRLNPVTSAGHAKIIQTQNGDWWAVFLATRPYGPDLYNTGRETFAHPVRWVDGWPIILPRHTPIPLSLKTPALPPAPKGRDGDRTRITRTLKDLRAAPYEWLSLRAQEREFIRFDGETLRLTSAGRLGDIASDPAFIGIRQYQAEARLSARIDYVPSAGGRAGLVALQSDDAYAFCGLSFKDGKPAVTLSRRTSAKEDADGVVLAAVPISATGAEVELSIVRDVLSCRYRFKTDQPWQTVMDKTDATFLSTKKAGGFVGTVIGLYTYRPAP